MVLHLVVFLSVVCWLQPLLASNSEFYAQILQQFNASNVAVESCRISNVSGCSLCHYRQIVKDLAAFSDGISQQDVKRAAKFGVHYQIIKGRVFRQEECMFPFRCSGVEHFLLQLAPKLPDLEFVVNVRDYPQSPRRLDKLPVFSFSKVPKDYYDIMYPAWTFWEGGPAISIYPRGIGRWDIQSKSLIAESERLPWDDKKDKVFFRGSRTSAERDPLILLSRRRPELADAQYTKNQAWRSDKDTLGATPASEVSFEDHCAYKYLFNFRGVAASFRFKHLFLCNSLVFHVGPTDSREDWLEFFYPILKPWQHFVPVSVKQLANVELLLNFVKDYPDVARRIADNGFETIKNHLRIKDVICYWRRLLKSYAKLLKYDIERDSTLIEIRQKMDRSEL